MINRIRQVNFIIMLLLSILFFLKIFNPILFSVYFILNGFFSLILFFLNREPLWIGIGGFDYGMQKILKKNYNRFMNLSSGLICLVFGYIMVKHYYG